jgi:hypothetical protein
MSLSVLQLPCNSLSRFNCLVMWLVFLWGGACKSDNLTYFLKFFNVNMGFGIASVNFNYFHRVHRPRNHGYVFRVFMVLLT